MTNHDRNSPSGICFPYGHPATSSLIVSMQLLWVSGASVKRRQQLLELHVVLAFPLAVFGTHLPHAQADLPEMHASLTDSANG